MPCNCYIIFSRHAKLMGPLCPNNLSGNSLWKHSMKILKDEFRFFKIHNYIAATLTNAGKVAHIRLCNLSNKHLYFIPCCFIYTIVLGIVHFLCFSGKFDGKLEFSQQVKLSSLSDTHKQRTGQKRSRLWTQVKSKIMFIQRWQQPCSLL